MTQLCPAIHKDSPQRVDRGALVQPEHFKYLKMVMSNGDPGLPFLPNYFVHSAGTGYGVAFTSTRAFYINLDRMYLLFISCTQHWPSSERCQHEALENKDDLFIIEYLQIYFRIILVLILNHVILIEQNPSVAFQRHTTLLSIEASFADSQVLALLTPQDKNVFL